MKGIHVLILFALATFFLFYNHYWLFMLFFAGGLAIILANVINKSGQAGLTFGKEMADSISNDMEKADSSVNMKEVTEHSLKHAGKRAGQLAASSDDTRFSSHNLGQRIHRGAKDTIKWFFDLFN
ncbi:MAG: hypothetical protein V1672_00835 [Candidatus Diapherotrites archaeon]